MTADLNTLLTALYVKIDDHLGKPTRTGRPPRLTDAELLTLAVAQALLASARRPAGCGTCRDMCPGRFGTCPGQSGYNKRLRAAVPLLNRAIRMLALDTDLWTDATWVVDSTPVECARSRPTVKRSELAGWAGYGYCASHTRYFWGLRLHLICTPAGLPITWALADPKIDERQVLMAVLDHDPSVLTDRPGLLIIADKGYISAELDNYLINHGVQLWRPSYRNRAPHPAQSPDRGTDPGQHQIQNHYGDQPTVDTGRHQAGQRHIMPGGQVRNADT